MFDGITTQFFTYGIGHWITASIFVTVCHAKDYATNLEQRKAIVVDVAGDWTEEEETPLKRGMKRRERRHNRIGG